MKKSLLGLLLIFNLSAFAQTTCQWAHIPDGPTQSYNHIYKSTVDHSGNIIEFGKILGRGDMNPSTLPGDTSFSSGSYNYYLSKTSLNGQLQWIKYFQDNSQIAFFEYIGVKVNSTNDIIVVGNFYGMIDFDLSASGVDTLRSHFPTYPDLFVAKYDSAGDYKWAFNIGDPTTHTIEAKAVTILPNNDIVISAVPNGTIDVDPASGVHNSIGGNTNIISFDQSGNYNWNNNIGPTYSYGVINQSIDGDDYRNTYVASVGYYELTMSKFTIMGIKLWDNTIGDFSAGARVDPQSILVEKSNGNFYVCGTFEGTVDFDPGAAVVSFTNSSNNYPDGFLAKYDTDMNLIWIKTFVGEINFGSHSLAFNNSGLITGGSFNGSMDFGNGFNMSAAAPFNPFFLQIDTAGNTIDAFSIHGAGGFNTINSNINNTIVATGYMNGNVDMDPSQASVMLNTSVSNDFTVVYQNGTNTILENEKKSELLGYPSPVHDHLNVVVQANLIGSSYSIYNGTGQLINRGKITGEKSQISVENFSSGFYYIKLDNGNVSGLKFIVE
jgi:hypothetical protein